MDRMKRIIPLGLLAAITISCNGIMNKPTIVDETYNPEQEELYSECADLTGIDDFIIGETTYSQAIRAKIYDNSTTFFVGNNFYNGYWGVAKQGAKKDKSEWIEKKGSSIKQVPCPCLNINIGQIKFDDFDLAFYNDKLAAIYFKTDNLELHKHYIEKYGNGRGTYYWYYQDNHPIKNPNRFKSVETVREERTWENERVKLEYHHEHYSVFGAGANTYQDDSWYLLSSKTLYPQFLEELNNQKKAFEEQQKDKNKETLNLF